MFGNKIKKTGTRVVSRLDRYQVEYTMVQWGASYSQVRRVSDQTVTSIPTEHLRVA